MSSSNAHCACIEYTTTRSETNYNLILRLLAPHFVIIDIYFDDEAKEELNSCANNSNIRHHHHHYRDLVA